MFVFCLVDVDRRAVEVGEAHREAAAVHEAGLGADPGAGVVVVVGVHPDAAGELDLGVRGPVRPVDAVRAARDLRRDARVLRLERAPAACRSSAPSSVGGDRRRRARRRRAGAAPTSKPVGECTPAAWAFVSVALGIDVGASSGRSPSWRRRSRPGSAPCSGRSGSRCRPAPGVGEWSSPLITTTAFSPRGRYQKRGSGSLSRSISVIRFSSSRCCSSACGIAILFVSSQSGCTSPALAP